MTPFWCQSRTPGHTWVASSLRRQPRTCSHTGFYSRRGDLGPGCTPPFRSPSANSSRGAFDSNPDPNPGSPTRAVRPSKSSAGIMAMALLSGPRRPGNTVICKMWRDQGCSKVCVPKTPSPRHQTGLTLAEDGLGSGGTPSAAASPPQPQHGTQLPASESVSGGRRSKWWEPHLLLISSLFGGIQASPEAECPLHFVCHYTMAWRGKGRARGAQEQGGLRQQPGPAEIFLGPVTSHRLLTWPLLNTRSMSLRWEDVVPLL